MRREQFPHFIHADIFQIALVILFIYMVFHLQPHLHESNGMMHAKFPVSSVASGQRVHTFTPDDSVCFIKSLIYLLSV